MVVLVLVWAVQVLACQDTPDTSHKGWAMELDDGFHPSLELAKVFPVWSEPVWSEPEWAEGSGEA